MDISLLEQSRSLVKSRWPDSRPLFGVVLGSGYGRVIEAFDVADSISFDEIPSLGASTVEGHSGKLIRSFLDGRELYFFQGRRHFYEEGCWTPVATPYYLLARMGARGVLITNAAGGIAEDFSPGDLVVIRDHINFIGSNPLVGPQCEVFGPRFPDMSAIYDSELRALLHKASLETSIQVKEGVYAAVSGPSYETPAEVRMLATLGADLVGMSTVPGAILSHAASLRVAGLSCVTNYAAGISSASLSHDEVKETTEATMGNISGIIKEFVSRAIDVL